MRAGLSAHGLSLLESTPGREWLQEWGAEEGLGGTGERDGMEGLRVRYRGVRALVVAEGRAGRPNER